MWEYKTDDGMVKHFTLSSEQTKRCPICGQYFKKSENEKICLIVPPMKIRLDNKKLLTNFLVHYDEWEKFCDGITTDEELSEKFRKHRVPKQLPFTNEEHKRIDAFIQACKEVSFVKEFNKPYGIKMQQQGSSLYVEYNVFADSININHRGKRGMFDGFYERQIIANIYNKMHQILNDGNNDMYNYKEAIETINKQVNEIAKKLI
jgi:hypothetical protein